MPCRFEFYCFFRIQITELSISRLISWNWFKQFFYKISSSMLPQSSSWLVWFGVYNLTLSGSWACSLTKMMVQCSMSEIDLSDITPHCINMETQGWLTQGLTWFQHCVDHPGWCLTDVTGLKYPFRIKYSNPLGPKYVLRTGVIQRMMLWSVSTEDKSKQDLQDIKWGLSCQLTVSMWPVYQQIIK